MHEDLLAVMRQPVSEAARSKETLGPGLFYCRTSKMGEQAFTVASIDGFENQNVTGVERPASGRFEDFFGPISAKSLTFCTREA